ncbi:MAG: hypothetical protein ABSD53_08665 [Terriglobales bacterium]|jgi:hypothetical protein
MDNVSIIDLVWLILKFLVALGLVALAGFVLFLVWATIKRSAGTFAAASRNASEGIIVLLVFALVALVGFVIDFFFPHFLR